MYLSVYGMVPSAWFQFALEVQFVQIPDAIVWKAIDFHGFVFSKNLHSSTDLGWGYLSGSLIYDL